MAAENATEFFRLRDQLYTLAKANLATQIKLNSANQHFFVFNPLSWTRTDYTDYPYTGPLPVHVIDVGTNNEVKSKIINKDGAQYLRILAPGVPSAGYKVFEIRNGPGHIFQIQEQLIIAHHIIDNDYFTIKFRNQGVITSLIDKKNGNKQLVNSGSNQDYINNLSLNDTYEGNAIRSVVFLRLTMMDL